MKQVIAKIGDKSYNISVLDNLTKKVFLNQLPLTLNMKV